MNRYKVQVNIYVDAKNEDAAQDMVTQMLYGTETMSKMWDVQDAAFRFKHDD